ncbi:glomulin-like [Boleophthalmus pectinirostris]|uniref:glomulin-like n=1 Tax=Boleophthalmus pectinirostris TaxID=150288 RepID=UPI00242B07DD|nr:glomulin-like [Boleophthalmus pectinirostris]
MNEAQVNDMIQRWRTTPDDVLKPEDYKHFQRIGSACISQGETSQLLNFIQDDNNKGIVTSMGCTLLSPLLCQILTKGKDWDRCQTAFTYLTQTCCPKRAFHSLLDLIKDTDPGAISETIVTVTPHLQTVVLRLDAEQAVCVGQSLSSLHSQMSRLPVPYTPEQEQEDPYDLRGCLSSLIAFARPFVEKVKLNSSKWVTAKEDEELRVELLKFCMRSLREPLLEAQLQRNNTSPLWLFANDIMMILCEVQGPLPDILFFNSLRKHVSDNDQSVDSRACVAYLLFVQQITTDSFPAVFSPVFILQCNMQYIDQMLNSKKESYVLKGLALYKITLETIEDRSLSVKLLELSTFCSVSQKLGYILRECPIKHLKESGLQILQMFIDKLDAEAKHKFFRCMLKTSNHSGIEGFIVKNIRNEVEFCLKSGNENKWFMGPELSPLLGLVLCLPHGSETDLLNNMDKIMESLNLLRYLLLRNNELAIHTAVWAELCRLRDDYVKMLRVCLSLSRGYYSSELKSLQEDRKLQVQEARAAARDKALLQKIKLKQEKVSSLSPEVQHQVLQSAMVTFDLMESLIFRIEEITEETMKM